MAGIILKVRPSANLKEKSGIFVERLLKCAAVVCLGSGVVSCRVMRFEVSLPEYEEGRVRAQLLRFGSLFVISQPFEYRCLRMHRYINYYNKQQIILRTVFFIQQIQLQKVKSCRTVNTHRLHYKEQSVSACEEVISVVMMIIRTRAQARAQTSCVCKTQFLILQQLVHAITSLL